jgi:hypothetical protein
LPILLGGIFTGWLVRSTCSVVWVARRFFTEFEIARLGKSLPREECIPAKQCLQSKNNYKFFAQCQMMVSTIVETLATRRGVKSRHIRGVKEDTQTQGCHQWQIIQKAVSPRKRRNQYWSFSLFGNLLHNKSSKSGTETV